MEKGEETSEIRAPWYVPHDMGQQLYMSCYSNQLLSLYLLYVHHLFLMRLIRFLSPKISSKTTPPTQNHPTFYI